MIDIRYKNQVKLLLRILPEIARNNSFALHGGTAINLFYHNMPRLSVDIDLTWVPVGSRADDLMAIREKLNYLRSRIVSLIPGIAVQQPILDADEYKLRVNSSTGVAVKIEVNTINRGVKGVPERKILCQGAQAEFDMYVETLVVPFGQLYGGKIIAALDRQHPRDLFDVKILFDNHSYNEELKAGVLFCMLSSKRPFQELLDPSLPDHRAVLEKQFSGMTDYVFTYEMFEHTRIQLIKDVVQGLTYEDKSFLLSFASGDPAWPSDDFGSFPGVAWKLLNIHKLKKINPSKFKTQMTKLEYILFH